jgi:predicted Fe-Mo cluster-binding NifX family protein
MKVAVSASGPGLDAEVDPRFGRCSYFVIVDSETMDFEAVENPNTMAAGGAGIQSAQLVADKGAGVVLTGHCGPNAFQTLQAANIGVCVGAAGTVRQVVEQYMAGSLTATQGPSVASKFGVGGPQGPAGSEGPMGPGMGGGMGGGRGGGMGGGMGGGRGGGMGGGRGGGMGGGRGGGMGRGMGSGRGMGRGMGMGRGGGWGGVMDFGAAPAWREQGAGELDMLKAQADALKSQLEQIARRIEDLEHGDSK